jgi:hypothetical protein
MSISRELRSILGLRIIQLLALVCLLASLAAVTIGFKLSVLDPDIWWHLKVGDWILQNRAVPHVGIFSRTAGSHPWVAYSWGYEVLMSLIYSAFGLFGFAIFGVVLTLAVAGVLFWMLHRLAHSFWTAWLLALLGAWAFLFSLFPRPVFVSMILFMVVLTLLLEAQRFENIKPLYWLPLIFVLWANIHIQFIYGIFVVGLYTGVHLLHQLAEAAGITPSVFYTAKLPAKKLLGILTACAVACCIGPYSYHLYEVVLVYSRSQAPYTFIQELQALDFSRPTEYLLVLLTAAGFFAVGWQKKLDLFQLLLLVVAAVCAFRTRRDAWFVAVCAAAFMANSWASEDQRQPSFKVAELGGVAVAVFSLLLLVALNTGFNTREIDRAISREFPVDAVNFLRRHPLPGPLYNDLNWGGFLIWYMPGHPVAIDGRNDLYGDELDILFHNTVLGDYNSNPYLKEAGTVLLPTNAPLATMLTVDPRFRVVYQDRLAIIFAPASPLAALRNPSLQGEGQLSPQ